MNPIKPGNRHKYPPDWKAISLSVRRSAGQRCERCRVCNGATGYRYGPDKTFRAVSRSNRGGALIALRDHHPKFKFTRIVLTVHHQDGDPTNNSRKNLIALCQRCHLMADQKIRRDRKNQEGES